jgi:protein-disulfide isomerase
MIKDFINKPYIKQIFLIFLFLIFVSCDQSKVKNNEISNAKAVVKVFSSLTCPHCANFHQEVILQLKKNYIDTNLIKFEHHSFPLDLAALNAEKILSCFVDKEKKFNFLTQMYKKQKKWAIGSDINIINDSIKTIGKEIGLSNDSMDKCLSNKEIEDQILDERIKAQKEYKISSTPTIYINKKQYKGKHDYKLFKKELDKSF